MKNRTLFFGEGLFETFRVYVGRKLAFVEEHLDRMAEGSRFFALPFSRQEAVDALITALENIPHNTEARLRLNLVSYGDHAVENTAFETAWEPVEDMSTRLASGVKLGLAPFQRFSRSPLVRFKTTSYLENIFAFSWLDGRASLTPFSPTSVKTSQRAVSQTCFLFAKAASIPRLQKLGFFRVSHASRS